MVLTALIVRVQLKELEKRVPEYEGQKAPFRSAATQPSSSRAVGQLQTSFCESSLDAITTQSCTMIRC